MNSNTKRTDERLPPVPDLNEILELKNDGTLWWREMPKRLKANEHGRAIWNAKYKGKQAIATPSGNGYLQGKILGVRVYAHAVVFKMTHGYEAVEVDHKDGNPSNNKPDNLRAASRSLNARNRKRVDGTRSVRPGVYWDARVGKWRAEIKLRGVKTHLGCFASREDAIAARVKAEEGKGFTERHGS